MSFGFSVGDFIAVSTLAFRIYNSCKDFTQEFRQISRDVACLQYLLESMTGNIRDYPLRLNEIDQAIRLKNSCQEVLEDLQRLLQAYNEDSKQNLKIFRKLRWALKDMTGIRTRLNSNLTMLTAFNASLMNSYQARLERSLETLKMSGINNDEGGVGEHDSVADSTPSPTSPQELYVPRGHVYRSIAATGDSIQVNGDIGGFAVPVQNVSHEYTYILSTGNGKQVNGNIAGPVSVFWEGR